MHTVRKVAHIVLVVACMSISAGYWSAKGNVVPKAQPVLLAMAAARPDVVMSVIVQKAGQDNSSEALVTDLGGMVTQELRIINAFAANLPGQAVPDLARSASVRWVSYDAPVKSADGGQWGQPDCGSCVDTSNLKSAFVRAIRADQVWNNAPYRQGQGVTVAVVDSGVDPNGDLVGGEWRSRLIANVRFNTDWNQTFFDTFGHGTFVASVIGGNGSQSDGQYIGVAPMANLINVKVSNDDGSAPTRSVVSGLQWVLDHKDQYNIRIVNLSLNSTVDESYNTSPLDAAVEVLWFDGITVVVSAGNSGSGALYAPANDPFVITVGATDDKSTPSLADDQVASFSAYGTTSDGFNKPDLVAPGRNIVARIVNIHMGLAAAHLANVLPGGQYFRMSGTSVAAPMVSGAAAILLQDEPNLTPDQVKYRLKATANKAWAGYNAAQAGAGYLDVLAAVQGTSTQSSNSGLTASQLLWSGSTPVTWDSVNWNSVNWNSVNWNSVNWNSVNWNSVNWNSDFWGQ